MAFGKTGIDWRSTLAAVWRSNRHFMKPIAHVDLIEPDSLLGIDEQKALLYKNTENFLRSKPCSHALLWGARGVGKSSLIKTLLTRYHNYGLRMIQMPRDDLHLLPDVTDDIRDHNYHFIIYCDDLRFDKEHREYALLKTCMEGNLEKTPTNVRIYATSDRQHLMPEQMTENAILPDGRNGSSLSATELEECLSLTNRFGLSLSFDPMDKETYLDIVNRLFKGKNIDQDALHEEAVRFAMQRGGYSGLAARHFLNHYQMYL